MTDYLGLMGSQMVGVSAATGAILFSHAAAAKFPAEAELDYVRLYHAVDPRLPLLQARGIGDWLYDEDAFGEDLASSNAYYRDFLIPYGARYTASVKLLEQDGEIVLLALVSRLRDVAFDVSRRRALTVFGLHLRHAAAIYQKTRRAFTAAIAGSAILDRLTRPTFLLSANCTVSFASAAAKRYLEQENSNLKIQGSALMATNAKSRLELSQAILSLIAAVDSESSSKRLVIRLKTVRGTDDAAATLTALVPQQTMYAFGNLTQVLLIVHERAHRSQPDIALWEAVYSLTPGQSRVALETYHGNSVREAAQHLQVSESTVKTQLKEVFAKTNTKRQSQLVLALSSLAS